MPEGFPVEAGHIMMFARSIGDANPIYNDESHARGTEVGDVIAPPTFERASAHFRGARAAAPATAAAAPRRAPAGGGTGLHAEQHYTYHRHPRVGDVLTATSRQGESWEKQGRRAGKLVFSETITEYRDQSGELVLTARMVGVRTERPVEGRS